MALVMTTSGVAAKTIRTGTVTLELTDLTKAVTFAVAMPNANYRLLLERTGNASTVLWVTSKTASGFTLNATIGISETVGYYAIED